MADGRTARSRRSAKRRKSDTCRCDLGPWEVWTEIEEGRLNMVHEGCRRPIDIDPAELYAKPFRMVLTVQGDGDPNEWGPDNTWFELAPRTGATP